MLRISFFEELKSMTSITHTHTHIYIYIYVYNIWLIHQWVSILEYERFEPKSLIWQQKAYLLT